MPEISTRNKTLKGFEQHGAIFEEINDSRQAIGSCPFCQKKRKFFVNVDNLLWDCKSCGLSGNRDKFLELKSRIYQEGFKDRCLILSENRGLKPQTLRAWGCGWSGDFFTVPRSGNLSRYTTDIFRFWIEGGTTKGLSTSAASLSLIVPLELHQTQTVWLAEGEWDAMALWECLRRQGIKDDVYGAPGAGNLPRKILDLFLNRHVKVIYDADDPGLQGMRKVSGMLSGLAASCEFVHWPEGTPDGYDFRDLYQEDKRKAFTILKGFMQSELPGKPDIIQEPIKKDGAAIIIEGDGLSAKETLKQYRKWLHIPNADVIDILFGSILANRLDGDPLWLFLVAPSGGMKSELLMSVEDAPLIHLLTILTPHTLISGANTAQGDASLIPRLNGKVLVLKDFTTMLSMNITSRDEIFGIFRDAYDGKTSKEFGTGVTRSYTSKFGILAGVTPVIEALNAMYAGLGERFLKYKLKTPGTIDVGADAIRQSIKNVGRDGRMRRELRAVAKKALTRGVPEIDDLPTLSDKIVNRIVRLAQWVAALRGAVQRERYTRMITFKPTAEIGTRLAKQLAKLAIGVSIWKKEKKVSEDTYKLLMRVACDTAPDRVEEIVKQMYLHNTGDFVGTQAIAEWTRFPADTVRYLLEDLMLLHIVLREKGPYAGQWRLSDSLLRIMKPLGLYRGELNWKTGVKKLRKI